MAAVQEKEEGYNLGENVLWQDILMQAADCVAAKK